MVTDFRNFGSWSFTHKLVIKVSCPLQNWLDPTKELKKQIRSKSNNLIKPIKCFVLNSHLK